jgi:hypothetical protein
MDEICGLKFHLSYVDMPQFPNSSMLLIKTPPFYEVNSFKGKWLAAWRNFKNIFLGQKC